MLFICIRWVGLIGFKGGEPFQKWGAIIIMASFKEGQTKNDRCKEQWFASICMTACRQKKLFYFSTFIDLSWEFLLPKNVFWSYIVELFSHQWIAIKRTLHFVASYTLLQVQNSSFWTTGIRRRQNFEIPVILKVKQQSIGVLLMLILSSPLLSLIFFSFAGYLVGLVSVEKFWGKAFRNWG